MKYYKFVTLFVICVLISGVLYPLNANGSSYEKENDVEASKSDEERESDDNDEEHEDHRASKDSNDDNDSNESKDKDDEDEDSYLSAKDRSEKIENSQTQSKSKSDRDKDKDGHKDTASEDKIRHDGRLDKDDQEIDNDCGDDDDFKHKNKRPCDSGKDKDLEQECKHDCKNRDKDDDKDKDHDQDEDRGDESSDDKDQEDDEDGDDDSSEDDGDSENDNPSGTNGNQIVYITNNNNSNITNNVNTTTNTTNENSQKKDSKALTPSTLAATGDSLFRFAAGAISLGVGSLIFGLFLLAKKAYNRVFNRGFQPYLYVYEA